MKSCFVNGCEEPVTGYSTLCDRHKRTKRRHGHPEQAGVTVEDLKPYRKRVKARMEKNVDSPAWGLLRERWGRVLGMAQGQQGEVGFSHQRKAIGELAKLREVEPDVVAEAVLAMYLLQEEQPRVFKSDTAFDFQLARRIRGLTDSNAGVYWDQNKQRTKKVYRDVPPKVTLAMSEYLKAAFGVAALYVAQLEQEEVKSELTEKATLRDALESLK